MHRPLSSMLRASQVEVTPKPSSRHAPQLFVRPAIRWHKESMQTGGKRQVIATLVASKNIRDPFHSKLPSLTWVVLPFPRQSFLANIRRPELITKAATE